jgi:Na+/proline symporter
VRDAMLRPKLLLLDEPSFGLAPLVVQEIFRILRTKAESRPMARGTAFGWGLAAAIGAVAGMMAAPLVYLDPDMMSGIQEINDRTNDSSLVTFQAPHHQVIKGNPVKA